MKFSILTILPFLKNLYPIHVEPSIKTSAYLGSWHQVATSRSTALLGTGIHYRNVSAYYNIQYNSNLNQNVITVFNSGLNDKGNYTSIHGYTYIKGNETTKRKLHFDKVPIDGNYWIIHLGPVIKKKYQYAIVAGPIHYWFGTRFSLYVLARNIKDYKLKYKHIVETWCKQNGFNTYWNEYVETI